jgi:hypothetical protein
LYVLCPALTAHDQGETETYTQTSSLHFAALPVLVLLRIDEKAIESFVVLLG